MHDLMVVAVTQRMLHLEPDEHVSYHWVHRSSGVLAVLRQSIQVLRIYMLILINKS